MKIDKPGIYPHLPIDDYLGDCAPGISTSASFLSMVADCPAKAWAHSYLNPQRMERKTAALDFGRSAHAWVLGEPEWAKHFVVSPYDDFRTKDARAWRDGETRAVIKADDFETIKAMAATIIATPNTARAFEKGTPEVSIIWQDEATGIWLKARPDWLPADTTQRFASEYKSCRTIEPRQLSADVFRYFYDGQAAMIFDGLRAVTGKRPLGVAHIVQEKEPPYLCDLRMFQPEQIDIGRARYRHALRIFVRCLARMKAGDPPHVAWPGYTETPQFFSTPKWVTDSLMEFEDDEPSANDRAIEFGATLAAG